MLLEWHNICRHNIGIVCAEILVFLSRKTSIIEGLVWILQTFGRRSAAYICQVCQFSSYFPSGLHSLIKAPSNYVLLEILLFNSFNKNKKYLLWLRRSIYFDSYQYSVCPRGLAILNITVCRDVLFLFNIHILIQRRPQSGDNVAGVDTYKHSLPPLLLSPSGSNG